MIKNGITNKGGVALELFRSGKTLSIDFGAEEIKIVEGKATKKGVMVNKEFTVKLPEEVYVDGEIKDMDQLSYLLKTGLTEHSIGSMDVHGVINSSKIIMREITMPMVSDDHIISILSYQLEDYIPINPEDYVVKFIKLGSVFEDTIEKVNLLLIGIPKHIVEAHFNLLKSVDLKPVALDYQGNAINKLINLGENINEIYNNRDTITNIDIGFDSTSITISNSGVIKVSRILEGGANDILLSLKEKFDLSEDELIDKIMGLKDIAGSMYELHEDYEIYLSTKETLQAIIDRIEMIFRYYRTREIGNEINLVLLHGGLSNINGIEKMFSESFDIPCVKLESISKLKFNGNLSKYANAIGGLIRLDVKK